MVINRRKSQITNDFPIQQGLFKTENITSTETPINSTKTIKKTHKNNLKQKNINFLNFFKTKKNRLLIAFQTLVL